MIIMVSSQKADYTYARQCTYLKTRSKNHQRFVPIQNINIASICKDGYFHHGPILKKNVQSPYHTSFRQSI